ncbi:MAG: hypothetical protein A2X34_04685 [Elusimicrobia bacterium GWC2_51_8]|nr:MAG: hypothetical protein A2X33_10395 [Elusimicrobia bacterium GWA2_51_34]OGR58499.1 MAG: hypothetical protein A2X34_04685 [Elusimicrobia bacterium GWC2_51_8]HAF95528.1 hypothetical protein [Elusimicrobiota bacterium]HCE98358.1 hypothetical protein [Elusimicrobiota bacterium]
MNEKFDENSLNEKAINDVETARLALRWSLDKIRGLQEEALKTRQDLQERSSQVAFLENQLKSKNSEIEKILRSHDDEMKSKQDSLEYQFHSKLERLNEREKELEGKLSRQEEILKQKENKLLDDYQKKSEELRARWSQVEAELWQLRQKQLAKQQDFEKLYSDRLEDERKKISGEAELIKASQEKAYHTRLEELDKREAAAAEELKKQEAVFRWGRDSWQKEVDDREKALKQKDLEIDKRLLEKNQEMEDYKAKLSLMEKQLAEFPENLRRRDQDLNRYKDALASLEGVIKTIETEKKNQFSQLSAALEAEKSRCGDLEAEIPKRLKIAVEHERNRFGEKLAAIESSYKQDLKKGQEEIEYLSRNLRTFEETMKTMQTDRDALSQKADRLQTQLNIKAEEISFREKQLQSEYEVRLKVELEKHTTALKTEMETGGRIYEDSLRMKVEEIAHLRKDLEESSRDKGGLQNLAATLRRELAALGEKRERDLQALKIQLKAAHEAELAQVFDGEARRHGEEKQKMLAAFDEAAAGEKLFAARKEEELQNLKMALAKEQENRKLALAGASAEKKEALEAQAARYGEERGFDAEKIVQLSKALEAAKIEREELVLMERERLARLYTEKEKDFDEQLLQKDRETARLKDELKRLGAEKDARLLETEGEKSGLQDKNRALLQRVLSFQAEARLEVEAAVRKENEKAAEQLARKNQEIEAVKQLRETQEDAYRRTLEDFRSKLSETVAKTEGFKKLADERQARLNALETELSYGRKRWEDQLAALALKLENREKEFTALKSDSEDFKSAFEEEVRESQKKVNDALLKFRSSEEQRTAKEKQAEQFKREGEFWKAEALRKEEELGAAKNSSALAQETQAREIRASRERDAAAFTEREKLLNREVAALREVLGEKEALAEQLKAAEEEYKKMNARLKAMLEEERKKRADAEINADGVGLGLAQKDEELRVLAGELEAARRELKTFKEKLKTRKSR